MEELYVEERVLSVADYMIETDDTIRKTASFFGISKTTVHKELRIRLREIDLVKYERIDKILQVHTKERSSRGGVAAKKKRLEKTNVV